MTNENRMYGWFYGGRRRRICDLQIDDLVGEPFLEPRDTLSQITPCLILRIRDREDGDFRQRMLEDSLEVRREGAWTTFLATRLPPHDSRHTKCIVSTL